MKNIIKYAVSVFKTIINRCGIRIANRNAFENSISMNTANHHVSARKGTCLRSRLLLLLALLFGGLSQALAGEFCVANPQFNGVIDGSVTYTSPPMDSITQITIDGECSFINFTADNPLNVTINYQTNDDSIYLITFDNVIFTGNMACAAIDHKLWVVNSPDGAFSSQCQDVIIPAETIAKAAKTFGVADKLSHKKITLPGHVAVLSGELEEELPGWQIQVGPREAVDIPSYLKSWS